MVGSAVPPHRLTLAAAVPGVPAVAAGTFLYVALMDIVVNEFNVRVRDRTPRLVAWTHIQRPLLHALLEDENSFCQNRCTKRLAAVTAAVLCVEHDLLSVGKRVQAGLLLRRDAQGAREKSEKSAHILSFAEIYILIAVAMCPPCHPLAFAWLLGPHREQAGGPAAWL